MQQANQRKPSRYWYLKILHAIRRGKVKNKKNQLNKITKNDKQSIHAVKQFPAILSDF